MAEGSMAEGLMTEGSMAQGSMAEGSMYGVSVGDVSVAGRARTHSHAMVLTHTLMHSADKHMSSMHMEACIWRHAYGGVRSIASIGVDGLTRDGLTRDQTQQQFTAETAKRRSILVTPYTHLVHRPPLALSDRPRPRQTELSLRADSIPPRSRCGPRGARMVSSAIGSRHCICLIGLNVI